MDDNQSHTHTQQLIKLVEAIDKLREAVEWQTGQVSALNARLSHNNDLLEVLAGPNGQMSKLNLNGIPQVAEAMRHLREPLDRLSATLEHTSRRGY